MSEAAPSEGARAGRPTYATARWAFLRLLGLIYVIAFVSLWSQIDGLIGREGILPIAEFLEAVRPQLGPAGYWQFPTLCWLSAGDGFLHALCAAGALLSVLLILDVAPAVALIGLWVLYLSLVNASQLFLGYQWDNLLLEVGFLAIFLSPLRLRPRLGGDAPPSTTARWLLRWLLFRLMCSSGVVKLASGDETWRALTALAVHYETQPIPTWIGWYAHQLPAWAQQASCAVMFTIELAMPFLIFGPRTGRRIACGVFAAFMAVITLTGNYCFFNLLTVALSLLLLDDGAWPRRWRERFAPASLDCARDAALSQAERAAPPTLRARRWPAWVIAPVAAVVLLESVIILAGLARRPLPWPQPLIAFHQWVSPFRTINGYGLFAVMTTDRPEIIVEGSDDGTTWRAYEFRYKPGDPARPPPFVAPHQPRLDWQMWFAALGTYRENPWFMRFCERLLDGSPTVLALLAHNPFPDRSPRYLRASVYDYRFTDPATKRAQGAWWRRQRTGLYCPVLSLREE